MSISSVRSKLTSVQRDLQGFQQKLTGKSRDEASRLKQIAQIRSSITNLTSQTSLKSKFRDIERLESDIIRIKSDIANFNKQIASQTELLHKHQQELYKEEARERNKLLKEQEKSLKLLERKQQEESRKQRAAISSLVAPTQYPSFSYEYPQMQIPPPMSLPNVKSIKQHDVFISHASEDKQEIARPLAEELNSLGFEVWYDEFQLKLGDSLRRSIDKGLSGSRFGVVVLSPAFFAKNWTQYELDGLVQKEMSGSKVILPIWHKLSRDEVISYSPALADKIAMNTIRYTTKELAVAIAEILSQSTN